MNRLAVWTLIIFVTIGFWAAVGALTVAIAAPAHAADDGGGVYGWRGMNVETKGNTVQMVDWLANNTDGIGFETDARLSKDGDWFIWHDPHMAQVDPATMPARFNGTHTSQVMFWQLTTAEAKQLRYKSGRRVATVAAMYRKLDSRNLKVMTEIKGDSGTVTRARIDTLVALSARYGLHQRWETQAGQKQLLPMLAANNQTRICAKSPYINPERMTASFKALRQLGATCATHKRRGITTRMVIKARQQGIEPRSMMGGPATRTTLCKVFRLAPGRTVPTVTNNAVGWDGRDRC